MRALTLVGAVIAGAVLGSCGNTESTATPPESTVVNDVLPLYAAGEGGLGAALEARLVRVEQCVFLVSAAGERWLALWPSPGTEWDATSVHSGGTAVAVGTTAVFGGGETDLTAADVARLEWVRAPKPECVIGKAWWIHNVDPVR